MIEVKFLFVQQEWTALMDRVPAIGEVVTFGPPWATEAQDYGVSNVHWFSIHSELTGDGEGIAPRLTPYVSLRLLGENPHPKPPVGELPVT